MSKRDWEFPRRFPRLYNGNLSWSKYLRNFLHRLTKRISWRNIGLQFFDFFFKKRILNLCLNGIECLRYRHSSVEHDWQILIEIKFIHERNFLKHWEFYICHNLFIVQSKRNTCLYIPRSFIHWIAEIGDIEFIFSFVSREVIQKSKECFLWWKYSSNIYWCFVKT